jgi:hypothetical protein
VSLRRSRRRRTLSIEGKRRILVPFTGGALDPAVLEAALRIAKAEDAVLVPAYLLVLPRDLAPEAPAGKQIEVAMPLLEAVEIAALDAGVPVDARIERGRTPVHALTRLWEVEGFGQIVAPAPRGGDAGFTADELAWILTHAPAETIVLRPDPSAPRA